MPANFTTLAEPPTSACPRPGGGQQAPPPARSTFIRVIDSFRAEVLCHGCGVYLTTDRDEDGGAGLPPEHICNCPHEDVEVYDTGDDVRVLCRCGLEFTGAEYDKLEAERMCRSCEQRSTDLVDVSGVRWCPACLAVAGMEAEEMLAEEVLPG